VPVGIAGGASPPDGLGKIGLEDAGLYSFDEEDGLTGVSMDKEYIGGVTSGDEDEFVYCGGGGASAEGSERVGGVAGAEYCGIPEGDDDDFGGDGVLDDVVSGGEMGGFSGGAQSNSIWWMLMPQSPDSFLGSLKETLRAPPHWEF